MKIYSGKSAEFAENNQPDYVYCQINIAMLISNSKKFIFVHIKKTAGSSVTSSLSRFDDRSLYHKLLNTKTLTRIKFINRYNPLSHHVTASQIREYLGDDYGKYFSFAFVRNPFDWQVSNYFYISQHRLHPRYREVSGLDYSQYLQWTLDNKRIMLQSDFITEPNDPTSVIVDYVGKFENIDADFKYILSRLGLEREVNLAHSNKSRRERDYKRYYDDSSIEFIRQHYAADLELFDYDY